MVYLLIACLLQFYFISVPWDQDTAYHVAVGRLIQQHGILHAFPWTPFSWLTDHYADKELLFHLLFVPLANLSWILAAKIVAVFLEVVMLLTFYFVLRKEKVRFAGLWALLPLVTSAVFVLRFSLLRPHLMSITLGFLLLWAAVRGRFLLLAVVSAVYPWSYVAFWQLPMTFLFATEIARFLSGQHVRWKPAAVAVGGILAGLALHPNLWNLLRLNWIQMVDVLFKNAWQSKAGIELGTEFIPFTVDKWARWLLACVLMAIAGFFLAWRNRKEDPAPLAFSIAVLVFGILTARTPRFAEYFVPFSVATIALAVRSIPWRSISIIVFCATLPFTAFEIAGTLQGIAMNVERIPPSLAFWLQQEIPIGTQIFTTDWGFTGTLMLALPERKFIVALDPTLFLVKDPELYRLWYSLPLNPYPGMGETIRRRFGARFVISAWDQRFPKFYYLLASEPGVRTLLVSDFWMVFDLGIPLQ